ncbi:hypothetical protein [Inhella crocodyli]|jgi:hypothetical protein|uniref:TonB-dependent receptor plug domain-containing protein n=1 Tax=Inhella crocodyli TaxID=2499851 RepID=A0A437LSM1_9BURK|nr:hypothetical protein [Inhella crocodyli]RVT88223.1 hypothetical protein EOD73_04280 [Inhella crocodyli]
MIRSLAALAVLAALSACALPPPNPADAEAQPTEKLVLTGSRIAHKVNGRVDGIKVMSREEVADNLRHERRPKGDSL